MKNSPYWLEVPLIKGKDSLQKENGIVIIGSGLSGVSTAYWLLQHGYHDISLLDFQPENAASFRNAGHILHGPVESMLALNKLYGPEKAKEIWQFSVSVCEDVKETISRHSFEADYAQNGYLVIAIDQAEDNEIKQSIALMQKAGFESEYIEKNELEKKGFKNVFGGRFEPGSARGHPVKFRNELLKYCLSKGVKYTSGVHVKGVEESSDRVEIIAENSRIVCDAAVIAANAYSPLLSRFFAEYKLVEPFRGQIIVSSPSQKPILVDMPHSFDHGYEYALKLADNRLLIGGWRHHTESKEVGIYDLTANDEISAGLKAFVQNHYADLEDLNWDYVWTGIMASSKTGLPFVGPTSSPRIFTTAGFTGHGFSWAHGCAKLLVQIILGESIPAISGLFNPVHHH